MPYFRAVADAVVDITFPVVGVVELFVNIVNYRAEVRLHWVIGNRPLAESFDAVIDVSDTSLLHPLRRSGFRMRDDRLGSRLIPRRSNLAQIVILAAMEHAAGAVLLVVPGLHQLLGILVAG